MKTYYDIMMFLYNGNGNNVTSYSPPMEVCCREIELLLMIKEITMLIS